MEQADTTCRNCGLSNKLPSSRIDSSGLCKYCRDWKKQNNYAEKREDFRREFERLIGNVKQDNNKGTYDAILALSGGKDSTYALYVIKKMYNLNVLAITFDNNFLSPHSFDNIKTVVNRLGVDHLIVKPSFTFMKKVILHSLENEFHPTKALERASSICNSCMALSRFSFLRHAIDQNASLIIYGWSPGQVPLNSAIYKNSSSYLRILQQRLLSVFLSAGGSEAKEYFLTEEHFIANEFPYNVNPLILVPYDESTIYNCIKKLGWKTPQDTDTNSTNCLLNSFSNIAHLERHGYHPYAMEMSTLVRMGIVTPKEARERLASAPPTETTNYVKRKLELE